MKGINFKKEVIIGKREKKMGYCWSEKNHSWD